MKLKLIITLIFLSFFSYAKTQKPIQNAPKAHSEEDGHSHSKEDDHSKEKDHDEHGEHKEDQKQGEHEEDKEHGEHKEGEGHAEHKEGEEHGEHEEANSQVGPDKGILSASKELGIQLSPLVEKNFEIKRIKVGNEKSILIPAGALVKSGKEVNLFRLRENYYKRIDFETIKKQGTQIEVRSSNLKSGDEIVVEGNGFLLTAEIAAFGGAPEGHSH